jgi:hypothetical protein
MDEMVWGFVGSVGVASEGCLIGELSVTQRALMNVWEMCLGMKGSQDRVIGPEGAIDAEISTGKL